MNKHVLTSLVLAVIVSPMQSQTYNDTITAIFGGGNPNTGWTSMAGPDDLVLALRAKNRFTAATTNVNGIYSYATAPDTRGLWNYEFSIDSGSLGLTDYTFYLAVDRDSSLGINYGIVTPLLYWGDNEFGTSSTLNGGGLKPGEWGAFTISDFNIFQNSQNITFGDYPGGGLLLEQNATYNYELYAVAAGGSATDPRLATVGITVVVGQGGAAVPDAGSTVALLGIALAGFAGFAARRR